MSAITDPRKILEAMMEWVTLEFFKPTDERQFNADVVWNDPATSLRRRGTEVAQYSLPAFIVMKYYGTDTPYNDKWRGDMYQHAENLLGITWNEADELFDATRPNGIRNAVNKIIARWEAETHKRYALKIN